jgi:hypothetical protein
MIKRLAMSRKNPAAVALGRKGGQATAAKLTPEQRSEAARKAVEARWARIRALTSEIREGTKRLEKKAIEGLKRAGARTRKAKKKNAAGEGK